MTQKLHILVLIAFLAGIIAPACGFMWGGQYSVIEICTTDGIESRVVTNEDTPDTPHTSDQCEFCFTNANLTAFLITEIQAERLAYSSEKLRVQGYIDIVLSKNLTDISSRGPPSRV